MRRFIVSVALLLIICLLLASCASTKYPTEGVYYCDELEMSIDFSLIAEGNRQAAKKYIEDGRAFLYYYCDIDGNRITLFDSSNVAYIAGGYSFVDGVFRVIEDGGGIELVFKEKL